MATKKSTLKVSDHSSVKLKHEEKVFQNRQPGESLIENHEKGCEKKNDHQQKTQEIKKKKTKLIDKYQPSEQHVLHSGEFIVSVLKSGAKKQRRPVERRVGIKRSSIKKDVKTVVDTPQGKEQELHNERNHATVNKQGESIQKVQTRQESSELAKTQTTRSRPDREKKESPTEVKPTKITVKINESLGGNVSHVNTESKYNKPNNTTKNVKLKVTKKSNEQVDYLIQSVFSKQDHKLDTKRKISEEEFINNILQDPTTPAVYKKRILQALNEKYLENSVHGKAYTILNTKRNENKNKRERRMRIKGEKVLSVESGAVRSGKTMMSDDNSWVRTKYDTRTKPELLLMENNIEKEILPRFDQSDSSIRMEMRVRPTFRTQFPTKRPIAHIKNNVLSRSTQTDLLIMDKTSTITPTCMSSRRNTSYTEIPLYKHPVIDEPLLYIRPRSFDLNDNSINTTLSHNTLNINECDNNVNNKQIPAGHRNVNQGNELERLDRVENNYDPSILNERQDTRRSPVMAYNTMPYNRKSEIPVVLSDDEEVYPGARPATDVFMSQNHDQSEMRRYETVGTTTIPEDTKKGRRVTFFRNGDTNFKGIGISISQSDFRNFETLLVFLNGKIPTTAGVRYVFSLPDGKEIKSVTEFKSGRAYLASSVKKPITNLPYGYSREANWTTKRPSGGKVRKEEVHLFRRPSSPTNSPTRKARVITVENNSRKEMREKVIIDPQTKQNFEDILCIIGDLINMNVDSLYTRRKPFKKIVSFSQLFREFKNHDMFIACHEGEEPTDRSSYHDSNNSDSESIKQQNPKQKIVKLNEIELQSIDELNMSGSSNSDSPPPMENGYVTSRSENDVEDDSVSVMVNGKTRRYYPPSTVYADDDGGKPDRKLKLEWIYGYHTKENGNSLFVLYNGELVYAVSAVVVLYKYIRNKDKDRDSVREKEDTQRLYLGHTEEISSMALHPNNRWIASGQIAGKENKAHIRVWDAKLLTTFNVIGVGFFDYGIISMNFSQQSNGSFLCVIDNAEKHVLSIWDWQKERMVAKTTTSTLPVKAAHFYKYNDTILITYGQQHVYFWKLFWDPVREKEGRIMRDKRSGLFLGEIPNEVCSIAFSAKGDVLTGDSNGTITVWTPDVEYIFSVNQDLSYSMRNAHKLPVTTLCMLMDNTLMTGGGLEIRAWDSINAYRPANARILPEATGHVRTIIPQHGSSADGRLFIGTSKGYVLDGSLQDKFKYLLQGHSEEIWAIAPHPNESAFFTTSFDKMVIKWSTTKHKIAWKSQIGKPGCCLTSDLKGRQIAVGTQTGQIEILNAHNGMHVASIDVSRYRIDCIAFSPDGTTIAAGSHDGLIHILDVQDASQGYSASRPLKGHPTFVTHIDWSGDSKYIQSTDGQYNMINWDVEKKLKINDPRVLRDADWHGYSCTTGYPVTGPWTNMESNTHINAVHRSNYRDFLVTGDSNGRVRLYKYPSIATKPEYRGVKLYSSDVTAVSFLYDDMNVVTAGGTSAVLAQWSIVDAFVSS